jgi:hypothetical protein
MWPYVAVAAFIAVMFIALRVHIRRDERWLAEQARLDEQARRARAAAYVASRRKS